MDQRRCLAGLHRDYSERSALGPGGLGQVAQPIFADIDVLILQGCQRNDGLTSRMTMSDNFMATNSSRWWTPTSLGDKGAICSSMSV
ncbi:hypothetical protein BAE40_30050 [Mesorhizobium loti]|nr:hypothetical protein BAE40_30050 [Mesorhizobium loti]